MIPPAIANFVWDRVVACLKEVQEILGHRTFAMTLRYAHLSPDRLREAIASLENWQPTGTTLEQTTVESPRRLVNA